MSLYFVFLILLVSAHRHGTLSASPSSGKPGWSREVQVTSATDCSLCAWLVTPALASLKLPEIIVLWTPTFAAFAPELPAHAERRGAFHSTRGPPYQPTVG